MRQGVLHLQTMGPAASGRFVVVARDKCGDGCGELVAKGSSIRGRPEPNLNVQRQGRQPFVGLSAFLIRFAMLSVRQRRRGGSRFPGRGVVAEEAPERKRTH
jgi:hypothetical protein